MSNWGDLRKIEPKDYVCYYCGKNVGADQGFRCERVPWRIYVCPFCDRPTYVHGAMQVPCPAFGQVVKHLPVDIESLYNEARECTSVGAFTATVLACRKILMHLAVERGDKPGKRFAAYVEYLANHHYVPPKSEAWVERIRSRGNEANHEIVISTRKDAEELVNFLEMLLKFMYEFPGKLAPPETSDAQ